MPCDWSIWIENLKETETVCSYKQKSELSITVTHKSIVKSEDSIADNE